MTLTQHNRGKPVFATPPPPVRAAATHLHSSPSYPLPPSKLSIILGERLCIQQRHRARVTIRISQ